MSVTPTSFPPMHPGKRVSIDDRAPSVCTGTHSRAFNLRVRGNLGVPGIPHGRGCAATRSQLCRRAAALRNVVI